MSYGLSLTAGLFSAIAAVWTVADEGLLRGTAVMNGSARGTAVVVLVVAIPVLLVSMVLARRGSQPAVLTWLGSLAYLLYNALLFLFATPFNHAFLVYVAMLSAAGWSLITLVHGVDVARFGVQLSPWSPTRAVALYVWVVVALNAAAWLRQIVPGLSEAYPPGFLAGTGMPTSVVYVQDLALWLPLAAVAAAWLWRRSPWGVLIIGPVLTMWVIESISIAVDQWFGHHADPASTVASGGSVVPFTAAAVVGLVPLYLLLRGLKVK